MRGRAAIFMFHDLVPVERLPHVTAEHRRYALPPDEFRAFLMASRLSARRAVPVGQVPGELGGLFFSLTFDDGDASNYTEAFPVLREHGMRATFFIVPTLVDTPGHVTWEQLREMVSAGMEVGSHSLTHPFVDGLGPAELRREFGDSKTMIEDRLGAAVRSASLPRGWGAPHMETILEEFGYRVFCTSRVGWWHPGDRPLSVPRVRASADLGVERFVAIVEGAPRSLWGIQVVEAAKGLVKRCLGRRGWNWLRTPFLRLRYTTEAR